MNAMLIERNKYLKRKGNGGKNPCRTITFQPTLEVKDMLDKASGAMGLGGIPNGIRSYLINLALRRALPWVMKKKGLRVLR